jgi:hypothetical protein
VRAESPAQKTPAQKNAGAKASVFPCRRAVGAHDILHPISLGCAQGCYAFAPLALMIYAVAPLALRRQRQCSGTAGNKRQRRGGITARPNGPGF